MKEDARDLTAKYLRVALIGVAVWYLAAYIFVVLGRIRFPFEIQIVEGSSLMAMKHLLLGQKLYVSPSIEFVSPIYTPLYFYAAAFLSRILGEGFLPLRLLSFFASIGSALLIYSIVRKETGSRFIGFLSSSFFVATFSIIGATFDLARPDSLYLFFLLLGIHLLRFSRTAWGFAAAAFFVALSFFTKQSVLPIAAFLWFYAFIFERRLSWVFGLVFLMLAGGASLLLNTHYDGWFYYHTFEILANHPINKSRLYNFWSKCIFSNLSVASVFSFFYFVGKSSSKSAPFYLFSLLGALLVSWSSLMHVGGHLNVLFPSYAIISILFGLGIGSLFDEIETLTAETTRRLMRAFLYGLCIVQFLACWYQPISFIPGQTGYEKANAWLLRIKSIEGEVFFPIHNYFSAIAGKKSYAYGHWIWDITRSKDGPAKEHLVEEFRRAFKERKFSAVFIEAREIGLPKNEKIPERFWWEKADIGRYYTAAMPFHRYSSPLFRWDQQNYYLYIPKDSSNEST